MKVQAQSLSQRRQNRCCPVSSAKQAGTQVLPEVTGFCEAGVKPAADQIRVERLGRGRNQYALSAARGQQG